jgi:hypothetical protein
MLEGNGHRRLEHDGTEQFMQICILSGITIFLLLIDLPLFSIERAV